MIEYKSGYKYQLVSRYILRTPIFPRKPILTRYVSLSTTGWLHVRDGYAWDGASGPTIDTRDTMRASLVHDSLYQLMRLGLLDRSHRRDVDLLFRRILIEDHAPKFRAHLWYLAVRLFASRCASSLAEPRVKRAP